MIERASRARPTRGPDTKQRLRTQTIQRLCELAHAMSGNDFLRERRYRPIPLGTLVYLLEVLTGMAPLPEEDEDAGRLDLLLAEFEKRGNPALSHLRAALRERRMQPEGERSG